MNNFWIDQAIYLNQLKNFDALSVGVLDFNQNKFKFFQVDQEKRIDDEKIFFDLASLTKPLVNSLLSFIHEEHLTADQKLLLNHKASLPAWGLLDKKTWKEQILSYKVQEAETLYSDFSALRFFLEFKDSKNLKNNLQKIWDQEVIFWKELPKEAKFLQQGYRKGRENRGIVHDPNAYVIDEFVSHAGLFGTISGVCKTLLNFNQKFNLLDKMQKELKSKKEGERFVRGFDTVSDSTNTLAGLGADLHSVFGHLGFTGTSFWIDSRTGIGHVILSNATKYYWYDKKELNSFRKSLGEAVWKEGLEVF